MLPKWDAPETSVFDSFGKRAANTATAGPRWLYNNVVQPMSSFGGAAEEVAFDTVLGPLAAAGKAAALFPFMKRVAAPGRHAPIHQMAPGSTSNLEEALRMVGKDPKQAELLEQVSLAASPQVDPKTPFVEALFEPSLDDISSGHPYNLQETVQRLRDPSRPLTPGNIAVSTAPDGVVANPDELAETLRHELRHSEQSMNQLQSLRDNKSVMGFNELAGFRFFVWQP